VLCCMLCESVASGAGGLFSLGMMVYPPTWFMLGEETRKIKCGTKVGGGQDRLGRLDTNRGALGTRAPPAELERRARWPSLSPTYHVHTTRLSHRATQLSPTTHVREEKDKRREAKRQRSATLMSGLPMKLDDEMFDFYSTRNFGFTPLHKNFRKKRNTSLFDVFYMYRYE
jgi:hypothetical protein